MHQTTPDAGWCYFDYYYFQYRMSYNEPTIDVSKSIVNYRIPMSFRTSFIVSAATSLALRAPPSR